MATVAIAAVGDGVGMALAKVTYTGDPHTVATIYGVQAWLQGRVVWTLTALALAAWLAVRRSKVLPDWYAWLTLLAAVLFVLGGIALRSGSFFSDASGGMGFVSFRAVVVWIAVSSLLLMQRTGASSPAAPGSA